jgi:hypothetical protein
MIEVPLATTPGQNLQIILGGQNVTLALRQKGERMYMDIDVGTNRVISGAICNNRSNVKQFKTMPFKGGLFFVDTEGNEPPQYHGLDTRWVLVYVSEDEL